jgi:hypothetical protein
VTPSLDTFTVRHERTLAFDPHRLAWVVHRSSDDPDDDGLVVGLERALGLDPRAPDGDGDGASDGIELVLGGGAGDPSTRPALPDGQLFAASAGPAGPVRLTAVQEAGGFIGALGAGAAPNAGRPFGIAFDAHGFLFVARGADLVLADPVTGALEPIGAFRGEAAEPLNVAQIAFDPSGLALYGVERGPTLAPTPQIVRIDSATARVARLDWLLPAPAHALAFAADGRLVAALAATPESNRVVEVDLASGAVRDLVDAGVAPIGGLAFDRAGRLLASNATGAGQGELRTLLPQPGFQGVARAPAALAYTPTCSAPCFEAPVAAPGPAGGVAVAVADLDGDGDLDAALAAPSVLASLRNDGSGALTPHASIAIASAPYDLRLADLDGDGAQDAVVADAGGTVALLRGAGDGSFEAAAAVDVGGTPVRIALGDVAGDPSPDVVVANLALRVLVNDGAGHLSLAAAASPALGAYDFALADLGGDARADLIALDAATGDVVTLISDGSGGFAEAARAAVAAEALYLGAGDLDRDGAADVVVASGSPEAPGLELLFGDGAGGLSEAVPLELAHAASGAPAVGDVTGDGLADVVVAGCEGLSVLVGNGAGALRPSLRTPYASLASCAAGGVALADFDANGLADALVLGANGVLELRRNQPSPPSP